MFFITFRSIKTTYVRRKFLICYIKISNLYRSLYKGRYYGTLKFGGFYYGYERVLPLRVSVNRKVYCLHGVRHSKTTIVFDSPLICYSLFKRRKIRSLFTNVDYSDERFSSTPV